MSKTRAIEYCECGCKGWAYTGACGRFKHIWIYDNLKEGDRQRVYVYSGHGHIMGTLIDRYPSLDKALADLTAFSAALLINPKAPWSPMNRTAAVVRPKRSKKFGSGRVDVKCKHLVSTQGPHGTMHHIIFDPDAATAKAIQAWHESEEDAVIHVEDRSGSHVCNVSAKAMKVLSSYGTIVVTTNR